MSTTCYRIYPCDAVLTTFITSVQVRVCLRRVTAERMCPEPAKKPKPKKRRKNRRMLFNRIKERRATRRKHTNNELVPTLNAPNPTQAFRGFTECETLQSAADCTIMDDCLQNMQVTPHQSYLWQLRISNFLACVKTFHFLTENRFSAQENQSPVSV